MIHKLLGWLRHTWVGWTAAAEYWRQRAIRAERRLEAERWRNYFREDSLINVPMRSQGMWPIPPRVGPAQHPDDVKKTQQPVDPIAVFNTLSPLHRREFETNWLPDAIANDVPIDEARAKFVREVSKRTLNDSPYNM